MELAVEGEEVGKGPVPLGHIFQATTGIYAVASWLPQVRR